MSRIHPECPDSDPSGRSVAAHVLLRREPAEEEGEEEDEGDGKEDDADDEGDDGYHKRHSQESAGRRFRQRQPCISLSAATPHRRTPGRRGHFQHVFFFGS